MSAANQVGAHPRATTSQDTQYKSTLAADKENSPVASLGGGDVVRRRQSVESPEIQGLEVLKARPKVVRDVFYGNHNFLIHLFYVD